MISTAVVHQQQRCLKKPWKKSAVGHLVMNELQLAVRNLTAEVQICDASTKTILFYLIRFSIQGETRVSHLLVIPECMNESH